MAGFYEMTKMDWNWRKLFNSLADRNEYYELELPRAWEPSDSLGASPLGEGEEARHDFLNGNQVMSQYNGTCEGTIGF